MPPSATTPHLSLGLLLSLILGAFLLLHAPQLGLASSHSATIPAFVDIAPSLGLTTPLGAYGPNLVDYDRDGRLDLLLSNHLDSLMLLRQAPAGVFTDVATGSGLQLGGDKHGVAWGDCDGSGRLDLIVTNGRLEQDRFYRNQGNNQFVEVATQIGIIDQASGRSAAWFDYDGDGDLDLLISNIRDVTNRLFRNNGSCSFTDITGQVGDLTSRFHKEGFLLADYDGDGDLDVFGSSGSSGAGNPLDGQSNLYRNNGNGTFTNVTAAAGLVQDVYNGGAWGDYDNDGDPDLFLTRGWNARAGTNQTFINSLYRNNGNGTFTEVAAAAGVRPSQNSQHALWADLDNDGDLDLYVTNAGDLTIGNRPNFLYENQGNGTFLEVGAQVGAGGRTNGGMSGGVAVGDLNNDGALDLVVTHTLSSYGQQLSPHEILQNQGNSNRWLGLSLVGQQSNSLGIGARIELRTPDGRVQHRQMVAGQHNYAQDDLRVHFGLGSQTTASQITVRWPSGVVDVLTNVGSNQVLQLVEGSGGTGPTPTPPPSQTPAATPSPTSAPSATPTPTATAGVPGSEFVVDNADPGFSTSGFWNTGSGGQYPFYGSNYRFTGAGDGSRQATFTPNLPEPGSYEVFVWFFTTPSSGTNVPHTINFSNGSTTVLVNRQGSAGSGSWLSLGTFNFAAGSSGSLVVSNNANGFVIADAVRFVRR